MKFRSMQTKFSCMCCHLPAKISVHFGIGKTTTNFARYFRTLPLCLVVVVVITFSLYGKVVNGMKSKYEKEHMDQAVDSVKRGAMSCREAARHYGIHRSTLQRYRMHR